MPDTATVWLSPARSREVVNSSVRLSRLPVTSARTKPDTERRVKVSAILYIDEQGADLRPGDRIETIVHCTLGDRTFSGERISYYTAKGIFLRQQGRKLKHQNHHRRPEHRGGVARDAAEQPHPQDGKNSGGPLSPAQQGGEQAGQEGPFSAAHIGLQLSFAAVAGILLVSDRIQDWLLVRFHMEKRPKNQRPRSQPAQE